MSAPAATPAAAGAAPEPATVDVPGPTLGRGQGRIYQAFCLIGAAIVFVVVLSTSRERSVGAWGWISGVGGGAFFALLFGARGVWFIGTMMKPTREPAIDASPLGMQLQAQLASTLAELEATRRVVSQQIRARTAWLAPLGVAIGLSVWLMGQAAPEDPPGVFPLFIMTFMGGIIGWAIAAVRFEPRYQAAYKQRVIPFLASQFGALSYRRPQVDFEALKRHRIFRSWEMATAEDEIFGTYRDLPLSLVALTLTSGTGNSRKVIFDGLLVTIGLKNRLLGVTAVISDAGDFGNLLDRMKESGARRVGLEDPVFERIYEVYSTDQVMARALLTPAFMERLMALQGGAGLAHPLALAE